ncbi:MAG: phospholipase, partial [Nocardioidaceae bacterium]|nr:phospholipase [Nocardioidaceae bacterium]
MRTFTTAAALAICTATLAGPFATRGAAASLGSEEIDVATTTPIKHLVVIYQENASFDHYFGTYPLAANPPGDPPFVAGDKTPPVNNLLPSALNGQRDLLTTNPNQAKPFRLARSQFVTCSQDHGYKAEQRAANGGLMNRFVQATDKSGCTGLPRPVPSPQAMGYFDGNTVTALWNYAQHFALSDSAFATTYGPSTPGALNLIAGRTSGASPDNDKNVTQGVVYGDPDPALDICSDPIKAQAQLSGQNVGDLLNRAGIAWGWFQGGFRLDPAKTPEVACEDAHANLAGQNAVDYEPHHDPFQYFSSTANQMHLPPSSDAAIGHGDQANHQYDLRDFWTAANQGNLPAVSFLKAAGYQDGHPGPENSNPLDEQDFLVATLNRLQQLPEWSDTAVILAWDDSDGWYDHETPPNVHHSGNLQLDGLYGTTAGTLCLAPPGKPAPDPSTVFSMRCGYGERLPLLVVSPYTKANSVDHTVVDQSSILRFIEDNWSLPRLGDVSFDERGGSLMNMFNFAAAGNDTLILNKFTGNPDQAPWIDPLSVKVTPNEPTTDETVMVSATATDPDRDPTNPNLPERQDEVKLSYEWFNGNTRLPESDRTLDLSVPGNGDRGDTVAVRVTATDDLGATSSSMTSFAVADTAPTISLSTTSASVVYSDPMSPIAVTTADPDSDGVTVEATGFPDGITVSQTEDGRWEVTGEDRAPAGVYDASVRVSDGTLKAEAKLRIVVERENARVGYTGDLLFSTSSAVATTARVSLRAHITQELDGTPGDLTLARIVFDMYGPDNSSSAPDRTYLASPNADGDAVVDAGPLARGTWTVVVRTDASKGSFEAPTSDVVPVTVYAPTAGSFVTGGGWVHDPGYLNRPVPISSDDQGSFGLEARLRKDGTPSGNVSYTFAGADGNQYLVRSTGWEHGGMAISASQATIAGTCDVTVLDGAGSVVSQSTADTFRLDV